MCILEEQEEDAPLPARLYEVHSQQCCRSLPKPKGFSTPSARRGGRRGPSTLATARMLLTVARSSRCQHHKVPGQELFFFPPRTFLRSWRVPGLHQKVQKIRFLSRVFLITWYLMRMPFLNGGRVVLGLVLLFSLNG